MDDNPKDELLKALEKLLLRGKILYYSDKKNPEWILDVIQYESWYTEACAAISSLIPSRLDDFVAAYRPKSNRKNLDIETYTISDLIKGLTNRGQSLDIDRIARNRLYTQISIVQAAVDIADSKLRDIRTQILGEVLREDVGMARTLLKSGYTRAGGAIAGVVLEQHLKAVAIGRSIPLKKNPTLAVLNDALKDAQVYGVPQWRKIQYIIDMRNICAHGKDREPGRGEIEEMIDAVAKVLSTIF